MGQLHDTNLDAIVKALEPNVFKQIEKLVQEGSKKSGYEDTPVFTQAELSEFLSLQNILRVDKAHHAVPDEMVELSKNFERLYKQALEIEPEPLDSDIDKIIVEVQQLHIEASQALSALNSSIEELMTASGLVVTADKHEERPVVAAIVARRATYALRSIITKMRKAMEARLCVTEKLG